MSEDKMQADEVLDLNQKKIELMNDLQKLD